MYSHVFHVLVTGPLGKEDQSRSEEIPKDGVWTQAHRAGWSRYVSVEAVLATVLKIYNFYPNGIDGVFWTARGEQMAFTNVLSFATWPFLAQV